MYRIELSPGDETVFRSIEELAVAIKRGVVTPRARIWHNASGKWLPIQFHPHYKTAVSMPLTTAELVAGPPVKQLDTLSLEIPEEPEPPSVLPFTPAPAASQKDAPITRKKTRAEQATPAKRSRRQPKPRRQLRIALVGALLIGGAQWVLSAPLFSRADAPALLRSQRHLISVPTEAMKRVSSPNSAAMMPVLPNSTSAATPTADQQPHGPARAPSFGGIGATVEPGTVLEIAPAAGATDSVVADAPHPDPVQSKADSTRSPGSRGILRSVSSPAGEQQVKR
jgi:hypothetical protein